MNILNNIIKFTNETHIYSNEWFEWNHFLIPNKPKWYRELLRNLMSYMSHCKNCTALDGCYFVSRISPEMPLHENCDCTKKFISFNMVESKASAFCKITKFTNYVFRDVVGSKGKNQIFFDLGYDIKDSEYLKHEYEKQALAQYLNGNYKLKKLDEYGQKLAIPITLNHTTFYSGWTLYPEGRIINTTPFGGWIK